MAESIHVDDVNSVIYLNVLDDGAALDGDLDSFTTRTVRLKRPNTVGLITITAVPTEVDALDSVTKLKLVTGTDTGTSLTGTGGFKVPVADIGAWQAEALLSDGVGQWTSDAVVLFELQGNLS